MTLPTNYKCLSSGIVGAPQLVLNLLLLHIREVFSDTVGRVLKWFEVGQGLRQGCVLAPILFNIFFTAVLNTAEERLRADPQVEADLVSIRSTTLAVRDGDETPRTSTIWSMLYADDAAIVSRSPASLTRMMTALVEVCGAYGLTVAERKTETMVMRPPHHAQEDLEIVAAGQRYAQTEQFVYLGGTITAEADMTAEIRRRTGAAWSAFRRYANVVYDRPTAIVPMVLKVRMLQAEVREALLYGCSTWTLLTREYGLLRTQHHRLLLRCVGFRKSQRSDHPLSCAANLAMTGCESVETTIRRRRLLFAGLAANNSTASLEPCCGDVRRSRGGVS